MGKNSLNIASAYAGATIILTTKHRKSLTIAPPFKEILGADVEEYIVDTDTLGTFSGETQRKGSALECARKKCLWPLEQQKDKFQFALASEGSFGPHPLNPFLACDHEILYFIDHYHDFHLYVANISTKTNYRMASLNSFSSLLEFAKVVQFPSHALILRPDLTSEEHLLFKGINSYNDLEIYFNICVKNSKNTQVRVETDMRAHFNPTRLTVIGELATKLATRLATHCPKCNTHGWGTIRAEKGLPCDACGSATNFIKFEIFGCTKCNYEEINERSDGLKKAEPGNCHYCNP
ncbi:MAG: DUF6671 family protein [Gammaproteobacteria bacterium]